MFICLSTCLSICLSINPSIHPSYGAVAPDNHSYAVNRLRLIMLLTPLIHPSNPHITSPHLTSFRSNFYRSSPTVAHAYDPESRCHYTFLHPAGGRDLLFALDVAKSVDVLLLGVHYDCSSPDSLSGLIDAVRWRW